MNEDRREAFYYHRIRESGPHYDGFDLASAEIMVSLRFTENVLQQASGPYMAQHGLSKSSVNILMLLRHGPAEGTLLHDLGDLLLVSRANITGLIDHLEEKGLVRRVVDAQDRRGRFAQITKKGEQVLNSFMPVHYRHAKAMLSGLSETDKATLLRLLKKTRESINAYAGEVEHSAVAELTNADY